MKSKKYIHIVSQSIASIGEVTNDIVKFLRNCDEYVVTEEIKGEQPLKYDILLCHYFTEGIVKHENFQLFRHKVLIFPVDGTVLKEDVVENINCFDLIITPANAGKEILSENGVTKTIEVVPNFYHPEHLINYNKQLSRSLERELGNSYVFYYEANFYERKGFEELMVSYIRGFSSQTKRNNVTLLIKTDNSLKTVEYFEELKQKKILDIQSEYKYPAKIVKISQHVEFSKLQSIWNRIDCYVHSARIEGFGIPLLRMVALEKPIVVLDNKLSGYNDFLTNYPRLYKVESYYTQASDEKNLLYDNSKTIWKKAYPNLFAETLLNAYEDRVNLKDNLIGFSLNYFKVGTKFWKYRYYNVMLCYKNIFDNLPTKDKFASVKFKKEKSNSSITGIKYICAKGSSGYAQAAKDYIIGLYKANIPITVQFIEETYDGTNIQSEERDLIVNGLVNNNIQYNKVIIHSTPEFWEKYTSCEKKDIEIIGMTVWEADLLDPRWPNWVNKVDKLIVPCKWNIEVFKNSGVTIPIEVIPHIYKPLLKTKNKIKEVENTYTFYTIGQWTERKGINDLIVSFLNTYTKSDNVSLLIKTFKSNYGLEERQKIKTMVNSIVDKYASPAKIVLVLDECTEEEISAIHNSGDCFISLCKSEGWGLGAFDAIGFGNPVIITGYGGQLDFVQQPTINFKLGEVKNMNWCPWHNKNQKWAYPDLKHAQELMRSMTEVFFKNNILLKDCIKSQTNNVRKNYTYKKVTNKLVNFLNLKTNQEN